MTIVMTSDHTMTIDELIWPAERIEHIAQHGVTPEEVEEVCFGKPLVQRAKAEGKNPVYYISWAKPAQVVTCSVWLSRFPTARGIPLRPER